MVGLQNQSLQCEFNSGLNSSGLGLSRVGSPALVNLTQGSHPSRSVSDQTPLYSALQAQGQANMRHSQERGQQDP